MHVDSIMINHKYVLELNDSSFCYSLSYLIENLSEICGV